MQTPPPQRPVIACRIDISADGLSFTVACRQENMGTREQIMYDFTVKLRMVETGMRQVLTGMVNRVGQQGIRLTVDDVYALRNAFERSW